MITQTAAHAAHAVQTLQHLSAITLPPANGRPDVTLPLSIAVVLLLLYVFLVVAKPIVALLARIASMSLVAGVAVVVVLFGAAMLTGGVVLQMLSAALPRG